MIVNSSTVNIFNQLPAAMRLQKAEMENQLKETDLRIKKIQEKIDYSIETQRKQVVDSQIDILSEGRNQLTDEEKQTLEIRVKEYVHIKYPSYSAEHQALIYRNKFWDETNKHIRRKKHLPDPEDVRASWDLKDELARENLSREGIVNNLRNIEREAKC